MYGAVDPSSGTSVLLEIAYGLGALYQLGWRPSRSILLASWDAEEYGIVGSTEWAEEYAHSLSKQTIAYINTDTGASGRQFRAQASPSLSFLIRQVTKVVEDPVTHRSVYEVVCFF